MEEILKIAFGVILAIILLKERNIITMIVSAFIIWLIFAGFNEYISRKPYDIFRKIEFNLDMLVIATDPIITNGSKSDKDIHVIFVILKTIFGWLPIGLWLYCAGLISDIVREKLNEILDNNKT